MKQLIQRFGFYLFMGLILLGLTIVGVIYTDYPKIETVSNTTLIYVNGEWQKAICYKNKIGYSWDCVVDGKHIVVPMG